MNPSLEVISDFSINRRFVDTSRLWTINRRKNSAVPINVLDSPIRSAMSEVDPELPLATQGVR
jgi:hypothetical protein